jgi:L-alanine-DL-glutamate epimerase-like enolase superfamily enzyme
MTRDTDIRVESIEVAFHDYAYRTPIKFGGVAIDRATVADAWCVVRTRTGNSARGFGSMPLGNVWAFPSRRHGYDETLAAMRVLLERLARLTVERGATGHPMEIVHALEPEYLKEADAVGRQLHLTEPIPVLCTLVCASPIDAAIHDGFGKVHGLSCYRTYGPEFLDSDLGHFLGAEFTGEYPDRYVAVEPKARMPLYHLVGALDPLTPGDVTKPIGDGLPEHLGEWIAFNGLTHLKIKLNGDDLAWDVERVLAVERVAVEAQTRRGVTDWNYSLDFNERCQNVGYLVEFLRRLREQAPAAFARVQYVEQPTARDLEANRHNVMHDAARLRPVVIDESLVDLASLRLAREMGYTGAALKACKGQTSSILMACAARKYGMFLCVQDLTCPGASLIHSAGLAAHVPGVAAIEANARQYCPAANAPWVARFPGLFHVTDGMMDTSTLRGPGLGAVH